MSALWTPAPDLPGAGWYQIPMDPVEAETRIPPADLDQCPRCGGHGVLCPTPDPQDAYDCPVCNGEGILPELLGVAS